MPDALVGAHGHQHSKRAGHLPRVALESRLAGENSQPYAGEVFRLAVVVLVGCSATPAPRQATPATPAPAPAPLAAPAVPDGTPAWIGVRVDPDTLRISQLINGAPGERAGLQIGDQLKSVDREPVTSARAFVERVRGTAHGKTLSIAVTRQGADKTFAVTVAPRPEALAESTLVGKPAPQVTATALADKSTVKLADLRGHVVILDFWATWCVPCTYTIPRLNELHDKHAGQGLRIVGFSGEDPDLIKAFVAKQAIGYTIAHDVDDTTAKAYLREGIPMFVVIDKTGVVRNVIVGADVDAVATAITPLL